MRGAQIDSRQRGQHRSVDFGAIDQDHVTQRARLIVKQPCQGPARAQPETGGFGIFAHGRFDMGAVGKYAEGQRQTGSVIRRA